MTRSTVRVGAVRRHLLAVGVALALGMGSAYAQTITGGLYGNQPSAAGSEVVVTNSATGYRKVVPVDKSGYYKLDGLNPGLYTVTISRDGITVGSRKVSVTTNTNAPVATITAAAGATAVGNVAELGAVQVNASATALDVTPIDVSTPTYLNHYDMKIVNELPTGRSMESIALLRSNVVYDNQTTGLAVLGGASPAENRYFYNGFDTTNDFSGVNPYTGASQIGANRLPAEALSSVDVLSSSGSASWTSVTGGLMAATVRQGANDFQGGYSLYLTPPTSALLNPHAANSYYTANGQRQYYEYASDNSHGSDVTQYVWGSGAIIKDKLFVFALAGNSPNQKSTAYGSNRAYDTTNRDKVGVVNLTWNISADQTADLVASEDVATNFTNQYALTQRYVPGSRGSYAGWGSNSDTSKFLIGNYNWQINDNMSLVLMGGYLSDKQYNPTSSTYRGLPYVTEIDPVTQQSTNIGLGNSQYAVQPVDYWKRGFNAKFNWNLGDHRLSFGLEHYRHFISTVQEATQGGIWTYETVNGTLPNGYPAPNQPIVQRSDIHNGGSFSTVNKSAYVEDYWQVADRWVAYFAARYDVYDNKNVYGENFMHMPLLSPRLGLAWDVHGDSSTKLGVNLGKYGLSIPSSVNNGAAGQAYTANSYYTYTSRDPVTQAPLGLSQIGPTKVLVNGLDPVSYNDAATNIKAPYQYELQAYWQQELGSSWTSNIELGFSRLKRIIDDSCYVDGIQAYANAHGYPNYVTPLGCLLINPGFAENVKQDYQGNGQLQTLTLPANFFGPKATRNYTHATFEFVHQRTDDEPYFLDLSYTWSHLYGNDDGLISLSERVKSGPGEQALWDYPGLMEYSSGNLASDSRHSAKLNGIYYFKNGLRVSSIVTLASGRPLSCFGTYPDPANDAYNYGPNSHYCNGAPAPAGTAGRLPFFWQWDAGIGYDWKVGEKNHLSLDLQVHNLTNRKGVIDRNQTYDLGSEITPTDFGLNPSYGAPSYQAPRTTMLVFRYSYL